MHADRRRRKWVVGGEDESAPILTLVIGSIFRPGENVVPPSRTLSASQCVFNKTSRDAYSRMLDSDG